MKRMVMTILLLGCSVAFASWRQHSIAQQQAEVKRLTTLVEDAERMARAAKAEWEEIEQRLKQLRQEPVSPRGDPAAEPPGPEVEGLWPEDQPYFYLDKSLLPLVRFEDIERTPEEVRATGMEFESGVDYSLENRLFDEERLNESMVKLLGMTDSERAAVEVVYDQLRRDVQALEVARIEKLDPPQSAEHSRLLVARIPALAQELLPLLENTRQSLETILGTSRAELLTAQATIYFNRHRDGLGVVAREFFLGDNSFSVYYVEPWGRSAKSISYSRIRSGPWEYGHLFDPGGPCELK